MNQNGVYVSMKSDLPTFNCGRRIDRSLMSTDPTFGVTYFIPVCLQRSSEPTLQLT
jgi:hypothetical protein